MSGIPKVIFRLCRLHNSNIPACKHPERRDEILFFEKSYDLMQRQPSLRLAARWPTGTASSVIKMVLRLMLVAITQETEQLHFNWSQFFTFVVDSYPTSQHCVYKSVMSDPTLLPPLTHLIYIPAGNLWTICSDSQRHLLVCLGSCYAVIIPPLLHFKAMLCPGITTPVHSRCAAELKYYILQVLDWASVINRYCRSLPHAKWVDSPPPLQ